MGNQDRSQLISLRVSAQEFERIKSNANALGVSSSAYLRSLISIPIDIGEIELGKPYSGGDTLGLLVYDNKTYFQLIKELRLWGFYLSEASRCVKTISDGPYRRIEEIEELLETASDYLEKVDKAKKEFISLVSKIPDTNHVNFGRGVHLSLVKEGE